jgi:hypothetical protein
MKKRTLRQEIEFLKTVNVRLERQLADITGSLCDRITRLEQKRKPVRYQPAQETR